MFERRLGSLPTMDFRFWNHLPPPFRLLQDPTTLNLEPQPQHQPIPSSPSSENSISNLGRLLTMSLKFITASIPIVSTRRPRPNPPSSAAWRSTESGCSLPLFRPYVAKVPWHGGFRGFLSQFFPRYGHYCGPNWSSGKDRGSMLWDQRPIDWLDFCCYCHDMGYDTWDQAKLLKADLAFLECLEKPRIATMGGAHHALLYRSMCIAGLRYILIPYRLQLVRLQAEPPVFVDMLTNLTLSGNTFRQNSVDMLTNLIGRGNTLRQNSMDMLASLTGSGNTFRQNSMDMLANLTGRGNEFRQNSMHMLANFTGRGNTFRQNSE